MNIEIRSLFNNPKLKYRSIKITKDNFDKIYQKEFNNKNEYYYYENCNNNINIWFYCNKLKKFIISNPNIIGKYLLFPTKQNYSIFEIIDLEEYWLDQYSSLLYTENYK